MSTWAIAASAAAAAKDAINRSGLPRRTIAVRTQIPYTTLNRKLAGRGVFTISELLLLAEAMGIPPSRLFPASPLPSAASSGMTDDECRALQRTDQH